METKKIILLVAGLFLISLVHAVPDFGSIPPLPDHFIGNVIVDGQNAAIGTQISIYVDSTLEGSVLTTVVGEYDLYVTIGESGEVIEFKISDIMAGNSTRQGGETIPLDLSLTIPNTNPSSSGSSGGSGGGGGGGGSSSGGSSGGGSFVNPPTTEISYSNSEEDVTREESQETEEKEEISPGITGAVIGFLGSGKGLTAIVFVIVLGIGVMLIKFKPLKWTKRFSH